MAALLTPDRAENPAAVTTYQRAFATRLVSTSAERRADRRAGRRDRGLVNELVAACPADVLWEPDTVYLQVLAKECAGHLDHERRDTSALVTALDHTLVATAARLDHAMAHKRRLAEQAADIESANPDLDPTQVAADGAAIVGARAQRARSSTLAKLRGEMAAADLEITGLRERIASLQQDRADQWRMLRRRVAVVIDHFDQRGATHVSYATRGATRPIGTVAVARPGWLGEPDPPSPVLGEERLAAAPALADVVRLTDRSPGEPAKS